MNTEDVCKFLANIPGIHLGGCLVSAYAFQQYAKKIGEEVPVIVGLYHNDSSLSFRTNIEFIKNNGKGEASSAYHFVWKYKKRRGLFDADGKYFDFVEKKIQIPLELSTLFYRTAMKCGPWNTVFNRSEIPRIEETLGVDLSYE